ncbi:MAG: hypothetical protein ABI210_01980, partial [Abditibacteriaceae bacterium]
MSETNISPNTSNLEFVEELLAAYNSDPQSVSPEWQRYFAALKNGHSANGNGQNGHKDESISYVPHF